MTDIGGNWALKGKPESSIDGQPDPAARAIDGNVNTCTSMSARMSPWWRIDLSVRLLVQEILIVSAADCCGKLLKCYYLTPAVTCWE